MYEALAKVLLEKNVDAYGIASPSPLLTALQRWATGEGNPLDTIIAEKLSSEMISEIIDARICIVKNGSSSSWDRSLALKDIDAKIKERVVEIIAQEKAKEYLASIA